MAKSHPKKISSEDSYIYSCPPRRAWFIPLSSPPAAPRSGTAALFPAFESFPRQHDDDIFPRANALIYFPASCSQGPYIHTYIMPSHIQALPKGFLREGGFRRHLLPSVSDGHMHMSMGIMILVGELLPEGGGVGGGVGIVIV